MAQLQDFPACCGAQILTGLYGEGQEMGLYNKATAMPEEGAFHYFTVAITNPTQHNDKSVVKALESRGFEKVLKFVGNGSVTHNLVLWAKGREWKPMGAKGNMKEQSPEEFEAAVEKQVNIRFLKRMKEMGIPPPPKIPRQPAGKKSQARRSTHGRGTSRTETSA